MKEHDEPILNLEQAKRYFMLMGCSHFHLNREDLQRAEEYRALNISEELESHWRKEHFERRLSEINENISEELGWRYFYLKDMMGKDDFYVEKMMELTDKIVSFLPDNQITYILDAIIGNDASKARYCVRVQIKFDKNSFFLFWLFHLKLLLLY